MRHIIFGRTGWFVLCAACNVTVSIDDDGSTTEAGSDATTTSPDGSGGKDAAASDSSLGSDALDDGSTTLDGGADGTSSGDAGSSDSGKVWDAGGSQCQADGGYDAGATVSPPSCGPTSTSGYSPTWVPPVSGTGSCTTTQIDDYYTNCLGPYATSSKCSSYISSNKSCASCLSTPSTATAYGALVSKTGVITANLAGCLAIVTGDTTSSGWGAKTQAAMGCTDYVCSGCSNPSDWMTCSVSAPQTKCSSYYQATCDPLSGSDADKCLHQSSFKAYYDFVADVICGP